MVSKKVTNIATLVAIAVVAIGAIFYLVYPLSEPIPISEALISISVSDQAVEDGAVLIEVLFLDKPGYVVIHKVTEEGKPGMVIGNSGLLNGLNQNLPVTITDFSGETKLIAMLHYDDGDGTYQFPGPDGPTILDEQIVLTKFKIT